MIIALSTSGADLSAPLDSRFGRAEAFLIFDTEKRSFFLKSNDQNLNAAQGAGIQSAQNVAETGAQAVISGHCGPKAFKVLSAAKISVYPSTAETVQEALDLFEKGLLTESKDADVEGHWV